MWNLLKFTTEAKSRALNGPYLGPKGIGLDQMRWKAILWYDWIWDYDIENDVDKNKLRNIRTAIRRDFDKGRKKCWQWRFDWSATFLQKIKYMSVCLFVSIHLSIYIHIVYRYFSFFPYLLQPCSTWTALMTFPPSPHLFAHVQKFPYPLSTSLTFYHDPSIQSNSTVAIGASNFLPLGKPPRHRLSQTLLYYILLCANVLITTLRHHHQYYFTLTCCPAEFCPAVVTAFPRQYHDIFHLVRQFNLWY